MENYLNDMENYLNKLFNIFDYEYTFKDATKSKEKFNKEFTEEENDDYIIKTEKWTSSDGKTKYYSSSHTLKQKTDNIKDLEALKEKAIREENFEEAMKLRDKINSLKTSKNKN